MKVVILGGGIGGLAIAHELSKNDGNIDIHIYERHSSVGGQARSIGETHKDFSEYCWHAFGNGYTCLLPMLKEIPTSQIILLQWTIFFMEDMAEKINLAAFMTKEEILLSLNKDYWDF